MFRRLILSEPFRLWFSFLGLSAIGIGARFLQTSWPLRIGIVLYVQAFISNACISYFISNRERVPRSYISLWTRVLLTFWLLSRSSRYLTASIVRWSHWQLQLLNRHWSMLSWGYCLSLAMGSLMRNRFCKAHDSSLYSTCLLYTSDAADE